MARGRERGLVGHVLVRDSVDGRGFGGNGDPRIETADSLQDVPLGRDTDQRQLDDAVRDGAQSRGLQVQEGQGPVEFEGEDHWLLSGGSFFRCLPAGRRRGGMAMMAHVASRTMNPIRRVHDGDPEEKDSSHQVHEVVKTILGLSAIPG